MDHPTATRHPDRFFVSATRPEANEDGGRHQEDELSPFLSRYSFSDSDSTKIEIAFLEYAKNSEANDEFDALIGISKKETSEPAQKQSDAKIPE